MNKNLTAEATTTIAAGRGLVWDALVTPDAIKHYMFGAEVESDWEPGSPITWKGEFNGRPFEDKGEILEIEPERLLQYSHFSPLTGKEDRAENYHTVTIQLSGSGDESVVSLAQDNNADDDERRESEKNWNTMLEGLKKYVEEKASVAA